MKRPTTHSMIGVLVMVTLLNLGCASTIGYGMGEAVDSQYGRELPVVDDAELHVDDPVKLKWSDGSTDYGKVVTDDEGVVQIEYTSKGYRITSTLDELRESDSFVEVVKLKRGIGGRSVGVGVGAVLDLLVVLLLVWAASAPGPGWGS